MESVIQSFSRACLWLSFAVILLYAGYCMFRGSFSRRIAFNLFLGAVIQLFILGFWRLPWPRAIVSWVWQHRLFDFYDRSVYALLLIFILADFFYFLIHFASHHVDFLWRFHRVHHSDRHVDWTTSRRHHLGEILVMTLLHPIVLFAGCSPMLFHSAMNLIIAYQVFVHGAHAGFQPWLEDYLISPRAHRYHHHLVVEGSGRNFGGVLSIWDRALGTFAGGASSGPYGVEGGDPQSLSDLLLGPFRRNGNA